MINRWVKTILAAVVMITLLAGCGSIGSAMQTVNAAAQAPAKSAAFLEGTYYAAQNEAYYSGGLEKVFMERLYHDVREIGK